MSAWLDFQGSAVDSGEGYTLTPSNGNGVIEFDKADVQVTGSTVRVRNGAMGRVVTNPSGQQPADKSSLQFIASDCPSGKTMCIGLILMCCGSGKVLGPCLGAWGC